MKSITIKTWLAEARQKLDALGFSSAKLDAELLLCFVLSCDRAYLFTHQDTPLTQKQLSQLNVMLSRRLQNEPLAFLTKQKEFYGLPLKTDTRALIPRGESEILVQSAVDWLIDKPDNQLIAEVGTGSGAIILAIAKQCPDNRFVATDISRPALALAQENAARLHAPAITFLHGNLGEPLLQEGYQDKVNLLVANLPYIPSGLLTTLDPTITYYEPDIALDGGDDGLQLYREFLPMAKDLLAPGGLLLCEHEFDQGHAMLTFARELFPQAHTTTLHDYLGHPRVLRCQLVETVVK